MMLKIKGILIFLLFFFNCKSYEKDRGIYFPVKTMLKKRREWSNDVLSRPDYNKNGRYLVLDNYYLSNKLILNKTDTIFFKKVDRSKVKYGIKLHEIKGKRFEIEYEGKKYLIKFIKGFNFIEIYFRDNKLNECHYDYIPIPVLE